MVYLNQCFVYLNHGLILDYVPIIPQFVGKIKDYFP